MSTHMAQDDLSIIREFEALDIMKEFLNQDPVLTSDTYLGARMNQKALNFHTQLHDWSEAQQLSALASKHANLLNSAKDGEAFLPVKKLAHIEYWTRQVNRYYRPNRGCRPKSGSFMKIDVTKYNMKVDKPLISRSKSAIYPQRQRPQTSISRQPSAPRRRFFGTDVHTVNNNLIDSQMHYSAQRKDLYSGTTKRSHKSAKVNDQPPTDILENGVSELNGPENESESITLLDNTNSSKISDLESLGQGHIDTEVLQPQIVSRSWSNRMLNVISIDDCKLTCRYRPQVIKENHPIPDDLDMMQKARANKLKYESKTISQTKVKSTPEKEIIKNGNEADDEGDNSEDIVDNIDKLCIDEEEPVFTNNNHIAETCHNEIVAEREIEPKENDAIHQKTDVDFSEDKIKDKSTSSEGTEISDRSGYRHDNETNGNGVLAEEGNPSSQVASKTSYGRITTLYSQSESPNANANHGQRRKKVSRASRINFAINDMVKERKVMNSLERDFDTRTSEFGRTVVEKTEGSDTFKKIHANLRKKIDAFVDTHSAVKTKEFYERSRSNSATNSIINS